MSGAQRQERDVALAYEMLSARRGAETTALRLRSRRRFADESAPLVKEVQRLKSRIARLELQLETTPQRARVAADIRRYREVLEDAESRLGVMVKPERLDLEFLADHADTLVRAVPADTAVIEFAEYARLVPGSDDPLAGERQYAAFVVQRRDSSIGLVHIGAGRDIDPLIERFRQAVMDYRSTAWRAPGLALHAALLGPLRASLHEIKQLVVVPAGRIGVLPLASLPVDDGRFLIDDFDISYRFSSRQIGSVLFEEDFGKGTAPAVIGAPDYGSRAADVASDPLEDSDFLGQFRSGARFDPLPEAREECRDIARLLGVEPLLDAAANEAAMIDLASPEMLHVSTHGFFMERRAGADQQGDAVASTEPAVVPGRASLTDSLERSGLALAGANTYLDDLRPPPDAGDGILYATEVAALDFMRTDLLTLSACQTGLGDVRDGDGVHGLQRAFTTAGARCIVCSLWEVPEKPTRKLFTRLYEEVLKGQPRGEALHAVTRELAGEYADMPVAWGGFVLYGETGVLPRFDPVRQLNIVSMKMPRLGDGNAAVTPAQNAERLMDEGYARIDAKDVDGAVAAFTAAAEVEGVPVELRARAVYERAGVWRKAGTFDRALADYDWIERTPGIPERRRIASASDRGTTYLMAGRFDAAAEALTTALDWPGSVSTIAPSCWSIEPSLGIGSKTRRKHWPTYRRSSTRRACRAISGPRRWSTGRICTFVPRAPRTPKPTPGRRSTSRRPRPSTLRARTSTWAGHSRRSDARTRRSRATTARSRSKARLRATPTSCKR